MTMKFLIVLCALAICYASAFITPTSSALSLNSVNRIKSQALNAIEGEISFGDLDGSEVRVGIIKARWNKEVIDSLTSGIRESLKECNVKDEYVFETEVPGSFELPLAARYLALSKTVDAIICVGTLIKGDTYHFEYISQAVSKGIMDVGLSTGVPTVFGVLTCETQEQAVDRSTGANNHGNSWGKTAVEMGLLRMTALGQLGGTPAKKIAFNVQKDADEATPPGEKKRVFF